MEENPKAAESKETLLSLQELEPSPVDDTPIDVEKGSYFDRSRPNARPPLLVRSSTLGLSGHGVVYWRTFPSPPPTALSPLPSTHPPPSPTTPPLNPPPLTPHPPTHTVTRTQKYSSYAFTAFLTLHLTNTSLLPLLTRSLPASDTYLLLTRPYYQSPLAEPLVVALPLAAHVAAGLVLRLYRRRQTGLRHGAADDRAHRNRNWWPPLSGASALGYVLLPFVLGHAFVNRVLPLWVEGGSSGVGLQYVAHGFARQPVVARAGYVVFVGVGVWHVVWGWAKWVGWTPGQVGEWEGGGAGRARKRRWYVLNAVSACVAGLWLAGGLGVVGRGGEMRGWLGRGYDELYRRVPVVGRWM